MPPPSILLAGSSLFRAPEDLSGYHSMAIVPYVGDQVGQERWQTCRGRGVADH